MGDRVAVYTAAAQICFCAGAVFAVTAAVLFFRFRIAHIIRWMLYEKGVRAGKHPHVGSKRDTGRLRKERDRRREQFSEAALPEKELETRSASSADGNTSPLKRRADSAGESRTGILESRPRGAGVPASEGSAADGNEGYAIVKKILITGDAGKEAEYERIS